MQNVVVNYELYVPDITYIGMNCGQRKDLPDRLLAKKQEENQLHKASINRVEAGEYSARN